MSWKKKILLGVIILSILSLFVDLEPKDTHISIEHPSEVETIEKKPAQTENPDESITTEKPVTDEESQTNDEYYLLTVDGGVIYWQMHFANRVCFGRKLSEIPPVPIIRLQTKLNGLIFGKTFRF